jgi:hypothetical protein
MPSKRILVASRLTIAAGAFVVLSASLLGAKPQPPVPVTATYRDDPGDALQSDGQGPYATSLPADGSRFFFTHNWCYHETTPFTDGAECLAGDLPDGFSMCGGGEIVVTPQWESFFAMSIGESQPADATARVVGSDNFRYFVRFKPTDPIVSDPNCSTQITITRVDSNHWEIEGFADDVARVLTNKIKGGPAGYTNRGHYLAPFKITLSQP